MIILKISDQLGNQMFAYASVKSIALDLGQEFKVYPAKHHGTLCNDSDPTYGHTIDTIFETIGKECVDSLPTKVNFFQEDITIYSESAFENKIYSFSGDIIMAGHYICPRYFMHRITEVRRWFCFPDPVTIKAQHSIDTIRRKFPNTVQIISVHFRVGDDYRTNGFLMHASYWFRAANHISKKLGSNAPFAFVVFYDRKTHLVERFIRKYNAFAIHNSLVTDMCAISRCDAHIVCNSSYSIMSALLNPHARFVVRPDKFWIPNGYLPNNVFPEDWIAVKSHIDPVAEWTRHMKKLKRSIKKAIKNTIRDIVQFLKT